MTLVANTREEMGKCTEVKVGRVKQHDCKSVGLRAVLACSGYVLWNDQSVLFFF